MLCMPYIFYSIINLMNFRLTNKDLNYREFVTQIASSLISSFTSILMIITLVFKNSVQLIKLRIKIRKEIYYLFSINKIISFIRS